MKAVDLSGLMPPQCSVYHETPSMAWGTRTEERSSALPVAKWLCKGRGRAEQNPFRLSVGSGQVSSGVRNPSSEGFTLLHFWCMPIKSIVLDVIYDRIAQRRALPLSRAVTCPVTNNLTGHPNFWLSKCLLTGQPACSSGSQRTLRELPLCFVRAGKFFAHS